MYSNGTSYEGNWIRGKPSEKNQAVVEDNGSRRPQSNWQNTGVALTSI